MKALLATYTHKLVERGLALADDIHFAAREAEVVWNRPDPARELEAIFSGISISTLLSAQPAEPYRTLLDSLVRSQPHPLQARDTETRTFLHDLPVSPTADAETLLPYLRRRKGVIAPGPRLITTGTVTPEQAYIVFSSMIHAACVLYCLDHLDRRRYSALSTRELREFDFIMERLPPSPSPPPALVRGPFTSEDAVLAAVVEAGERTVAAGLVDSYFGNVSCRLDNVIYISQTGSSLEELTGCIDACPMDQSSCAGITASSELSAHRRIYTETEMDVVLHGHPRFAVILSLDCPERPHCPDAHRCHTHCSREREVHGIPIVSGEVGTGPFGLDRTMPPAVAREGAAIVYGHGVFTAARRDFNTAFQRLLQVENTCRQEFAAQVRAVSRN